jgi:hypothetical protein
VEYGKDSKDGQREDKGAWSISQKSLLNKEVQGLGEGKHKGDSGDTERNVLWMVN